MYKAGTIGHLITLLAYKTVTGIETIKAVRRTFVTSSSR